MLKEVYTGIGETGGHLKGTVRMAVTLPLLRQAFVVNHVDRHGAGVCEEMLEGNVAEPVTDEVDDETLRRLPNYKFSEELNSDHNAFLTALTRAGVKLKAWARAAGVKNPILRVQVKAGGDTDFVSDDAGVKRNMQAAVLEVVVYQRVPSEKVSDKVTQKRKDVASLRAELAAAERDLKAEERAANMRRDLDEEDDEDEEDDAPRKKRVVHQRESGVMKGKTKTRRACGRNQTCDECDPPSKKKGKK